MTHTKLPWTLQGVNDENYTKGLTIYGPDKKAISFLCHFNDEEGATSIRKKTDKDNAELIVTAVNSHYTLTDEVKRLREEKAAMLEALKECAKIGLAEEARNWCCPVCQAESFYDYNMVHTETCFIGKAIRIGDPQ